jgi:hypothetical protein
LVTGVANWQLYATPETFFSDDWHLRIALVATGDALAIAPP